PEMLRHDGGRTRDCPFLVAEVDRSAARAAALRGQHLGTRDYCQPSPSRATGLLDCRVLVALNAQLLSFARSYRSGGISRVIYHSLSYALPLAWPGRSVLTIYDLSFVRFPHLFNRGNRLYKTLLTRLSARRADRIVTISEHGREEVIRLLGVPPERVTVAYPG